MTKKTMVLVIALFMITAVFAGCSENDTVVKAAMVLPAGTLDEDTYMESIWLGLYGARENKLVYKMDGDGKRVYDEKGNSIIEKEPVIISKETAKENTDESYEAAVKTLYDKGHRLIFLPGVEFQGIFAKVAAAYPECKFVAIDFAEEQMGDNMAAIFCDGETSGYLAGFTAALRLEEGRCGAIVATEDKNNSAMLTGFRAGVQYANETHGTNVTVNSADVLTAWSFSDISMGQQLAAQLYDDGVDCIFIPARATGEGAVIEAKYRRANGDDIWIVGCDIDMYTRGVFDGNKSVALCTAMRRYANEVYNITVGMLDGEFPGGKTFICDISNNGVGISGSGNNLTVEIREIYDELVKEMMDK